MQGDGSTTVAQEAEYQLPSSGLHRRCFQTISQAGNAMSVWLQEPDADGEANHGAAPAGDCWGP